MAALAMMTNEAEEDGSFEIPFTLNWEPATIFWTLTDKTGNIINEREDEELALNTSYILLLEDEDLVVTNRTSILRVVTVFGTYNYSALGENGVTFSSQIGFNINKKT